MVDTGLEDDGDDTGLAGAAQVPPWQSWSRGQSWFELQRTGGLTQAASAADSPAARTRPVRRVTCFLWSNQIMKPGMLHGALTPAKPRYQAQPRPPR